MKRKGPLCFLGKNKCVSVYEHCSETSVYAIGIESMVQRLNRKETKTSVKIFNISQIVQQKPYHTTNKHELTFFQSTVVCSSNSHLAFVIPGSKAETLPAPGNANNSEQQLHDTGMYC
jgi:hypothetical protein